VSRASPLACSGDMYSTVPTRRPCLVRASSPSPAIAGGLLVLAAAARPHSGPLLTRPKSRILASPPLVTKTFSGLMSRWMMPFECAASSASLTWIAISRSASHSIGRPPACCLSVPPSSSSMTMNGSPSWLPISYTVQIPGWFSAEAARASRRRRSSPCGSGATSSERNLRATRRPRAVSTAL
jgi:hypothetical protein